MNVRKNLKRLRNVAGAGLFVGVLCGCSGGSLSPGGTCGAALVFAPRVRLLYPISDSMGIPNNTGVVIYQTFPNGSFGAATSVPIFLGTGPLSAEATITSVPTTVPSPLPSSTAAPYPTSSPAIYAVAIPTLSPGVTYSVFALQSVHGCISTPVFAKNSIGSFSTALPP